MKNINNIEKNRFDEIIRNKLADYSFPVEEGSWNELNNRLLTEEFRKKRASRLWIAGISIAASVALVWFLYPLLENENNIYNESHKQLSRNEEKLPENVSPELGLQFDCIPSKTHSSVRTHQQFEDENDAGCALAGRFDLIPTCVKSIYVEPVKVIHPRRKRSLIASAVDFPLREETIRAKNSSLGLHFSSGRLLAQNPNSASSTSYLRSTLISQNAPSFLKGELLTPNDFNRKIHRPPFSLGLSFRKNFNSVFSLESGLVYTYLSSVFENSYPRQEASLDLHYLGVPLNLIVNLYGNRYSRWNIYFSLGGTIEKGLFSQYAQRTYSEFNVTNAHSNEKIKGFQTSLQSALGLDFKFMKNYSVFLEPEIKYYIANNQPFNIRTEHPLTFGLNVGLRYNW
ncbi:MAG: outer membrane beta-barrel protein [Candidatus Symbiothrix sp.]|jgi:hypothetical protein|nr:outer membrane beta-barrel protein [Candidatus Symbiothrix sp.]